MQQTIWSWNVNGLRAIMNKDFTRILNTEKPDILGLQETKLQGHQVPEELRSLEEYQSFWSHATRRGYSGTALFCRNKPLKVCYGFDSPEFDNEGRIIIAEYKSLIVYNIYFPNGQMNDERLDYKLRFYDRCLEHMEESRKSKKMVLVMGDYNTAHREIDLANPKENEKYSGFLPIERAWIDKLVKCGWVDSFRHFNQERDQYTWWSYRATARPKNIGWRIDYCFIDKEHLNKLVDAGIRQDIMGSDHCPIYVKVNLQ